MPRKITKPVRPKDAIAGKPKKKARSAAPKRRRLASFTSAEWYSRAAASVAVKPAPREA
jgi:hypothetical protein